MWGFCISEAFDEEGRRQPWCNGYFKGLLSSFLIFDLLRCIYSCNLSAVQRSSQHYLFFFCFFFPVSVCSLMPALYQGRSVHNTVMELRNICNHPYLSQLHAEEVCYCIVLFTSWVLGFMVIHILLALSPFK